MKHTPLEQKVIDIARPVVEDMGFSLVTVSIVVKVAAVMYRLWRKIRKLGALELMIVQKLVRLLLF